MKPYTKQRLSFAQRVKLFFKSIWWWFYGHQLAAKLEDQGSKLRDEAVAAIRRVVFDTNIAPDCVSAQIVRGGPTIMIKHNDAWEAFVHHSYGEAATKAIEWLRLQGDEIQTSKASKLNRSQRRGFDKLRKQFKREREKLN